jgi:hypothetical protein
MERYRSKPSIRNVLGLPKSSLTGLGKPVQRTALLEKED